MPKIVNRRFHITGRVQGVGYRYFAQKAARQLGLAGWVRNLPDGSVECFASGSPPGLKEFERQLHQGPMLSQVRGVEVHDTVSGATLSGFEVR
jgi:acylphosphatase